jgi:hypothetical protein
VSSGVAGVQELQKEGAGFPARVWQFIRFQGMNKSTRLAGDSTPVFNPGH